MYIMWCYHSFLVVISEAGHKRMQNLIFVVEKFGSITKCGGNYGGVARNFHEWNSILVHGGSTHTDCSWRNMQVGAKLV